MSKKSTTRVRLLLALIVLGVVLLGAVVIWAKRYDLGRAVQRATLPEAIPYQAPEATPALVTPVPVATKVAVPQASPALPVQANLDVPFTVQAPNANWDELHKEFCEEASIVMAMSFINNQDIPTAEYADQKMLEVKAFEEKRFGYHEDTTIEEVAIIFREHYRYNQVRVVENPTAQDIKRAVAKGQLVVVPAAGQLLGNPFFQQPGPLYHMLVVKGYTSDGKFITNDPGTRRGADFLYLEDVLMNALHNWRSDKQIELGRKVVLIVG